MKNIVFTFIAAISASFLFSCNSAYGPAITGSHAPYQARSAYHDSTIVQNWVSGSLHNGARFRESEESNILGQIHFHQAYTTKNLKATYGGFLYGGNYSSTYPRNQNLSYFGAGARGSFSLNIPTPKVDFNIIGIQAGFATEFGEYRKFRYEDPDVYTYGHWWMIPTLNVTTGIDIKLKHMKSIGIQTGLGSNGLPLTFHYTSQRTSFWGQINLTYIDPHYDDDVSVPTASFGVGIRLKK